MVTDSGSCSALPGGEIAVWRPATLSRLSALGARKSDQFDLLEQNWEKLVEYLGSTSGEQFAENCRAVLPAQPTSIACELAYLSRKPVAELEQALLRTRAFVSLLRCTGMRSITAVTLRLDQFAEAGNESGALLLKRMERKCGSARNVEKPVYVCVVPHADPKLCPLVHLAAAVAERTDPAYELFAEGFAHKPGQDYVSFATMVQRRYISILQCAAVAIGVPALFAEKKLHAFRVQCTNVMWRDRGGARGTHWMAEHGAKPPLRESQAHGHERPHPAPCGRTLGPRRPAAPDVAVPGAGPW